MEDRYLFRAKRLDNGEWELGHYVREPNVPVGDESDSYSKDYFDVMALPRHHAPRSRTDIFEGDGCCCGKIRKRSVGMVNRI